MTTILMWALYLAIAAGYVYGLYYLFLYKGERRTLVEVGFILTIFSVNKTLIPAPYGEWLTQLIIFATFVGILVDKRVSTPSKFLSSMLVGLLAVLIYFY